MRARRAALSRGWCAFDGRRPLVEFVSSSRKVRSPRRAPANVVPPRLLSFRPPGETEQWRGCLHPGVFLPTNNPFFPVSASRLWTTVFRVLTIGGNRSRVTVCRSGVWTMLQSVIVEGDRRGWEKKGMIVRARYSVLPLLVKRPLPGEGNREWTVVCKPFEGGSSGMLERNGLWILWGAPRTRSPVIEKRCFEECVVCCDLFPLLSFLSPLRKIFLSSCLRSRLKNSCCVASLRFESGNGLSFRRNGRRWVLFKTGLFPLSCFRSSSSHVSDWKNLGICCVLSLKVWVWKKIKFRKMKGGGYCLDWDWIFCWFFLFFFCWDFLCLEAYS